MARDFDHLDLDFRAADMLLIVPPFAHLTWPCIGVHVLQGIAREEGREVQVMYGNMQYAAMIGQDEYGQLCNQPTDWLLGERLFRSAAYDLPPLGDIDKLLDPLALAVPPTAYLDQLSDATGESYEPTPSVFTREQLEVWAAMATAWADSVARAIVRRGYAMVGATTMFEQTSAALAVLKRIKQLAPDTITLLGGANCEGPMGEAMAGLTEGIVDHVFAGESEGRFRAFLSDLSGDRVLQGQPLEDMDSLPALDYDDYFEQMDKLLPELQGTPLWLYYETSRGCWWGAKRHCTFCGLNAFGMGFRERSPDRVIDELRALTKRYPTNRVAMTDNIMPFRYHKTLIPRLREELPKLHIFYEQKANLTLDQVNALYQAGNVVIQPGIESLSSELLEMMRKGVKARQNIALLRYARSVGMGLKWNLLYAFPNDPVSAYQEMIELIPKIIHLAPPNALTHLSIDRFSPYFDTPEAFGIKSLEPLAAYRDVFPDTTDIGGLAYHFSGSYRAGSREATEVMWQLYLAVKTWQEAWEKDENEPLPMLSARANGSGGYLLYDTRSGTRVFTLNSAQARAVLVGGPIGRVAMAGWAIRNRFAVELDGWCVPLPTSKHETLSRLENDAGATQGAETSLQLLSQSLKSNSF